MAGMSHIAHADTAAITATTHSGVYGHLTSGLSGLDVQGLTHAKPSVLVKNVQTQRKICVVLSQACSFPSITYA